MWNGAQSPNKKQNNQRTQITLRGMPSATYTAGDAVSQGDGCRGEVKTTVTGADVVVVLDAGSDEMEEADVSVGSASPATPASMLIAENAWPGCDTAAMMKGLKASRMSTTLGLEWTDLGNTRYATMTGMRADIKAIVPSAFPYSYQFLYWEEVGVIDKELVRNLLICGLIIFGMLAAMIPDPKVAGCVIFCICLSIMDVVGLLHFWDVTISGVSTIYILICVGLAVDYSAHIAHMFKNATGTAEQRTIKALARIGPCVLNAVVSTFLAVVVIGFSKSYVFVIFFRALALVTVVAGMHGMWLLPAMLALIGG